MIDLRLHDAGDLAVALRTAPDLPLRPHRQLAQLMHRGVVVAPDLVRERQVGRVEDTRFSPEEAQRRAASSTTRRE